MPKNEPNSCKMTLCAKISHIEYWHNSFISLNSSSKLLHRDFTSNYSAKCGFCFDIYYLLRQKVAVFLPPKVDNVTQSSLENWRTGIDAVLSIALALLFPIWLKKFSINYNPEFLHFSPKDFLISKLPKCNLILRKLKINKILDIWNNIKGSKNRNWSFDFRGKISIFGFE